MINALTKGCDFMNEKRSAKEKCKVLNKHDNGLVSHRDWFVWDKRRGNVNLLKYIYLEGWRLMTTNVKKVQWLSSAATADARTWLPLIIENFCQLLLKSYWITSAKRARITIERLCYDDISFCTSTSYYISCLFITCMWNPRILFLEFNAQLE